jgi:hypothetical protein
MNRTAILTIYNDGTVERADMSAGDLRNIGQQLIAMADSVVIRGTPATNGQEPELTKVETVKND